MKCEYSNNVYIWYSEQIQIPTISFKLNCSDPRLFEKNSRNLSEIVEI